MTSRRELKGIAKQSLSGKWGFSIALILIILLLPSILNLIPLLGAIAVLILTPAITYVPQEFFLKVKRNNNVQVGDVFSAMFNNLGTYWGICLRIFLKLLPFWLMIIIGSFASMIAIINSTSIYVASVSSASSATSAIFSLLGTILFIVGYILTITQGLYYALAIYIKHDNPNMTCNDAVLASKELMTGHRLDFFILTLTFFGWLLLGSITLGIGLFYALPYMYTTYGAFYDELKGNTNDVTTDNTVSTNNDVIQF